MLLVAALLAAVCGSLRAAPLDQLTGTLTAANGDQRQTYRMPRHSVFTGSLGETIIANPVFTRRRPLFNDLNVNNEQNNMNSVNMNHADGAPSDGVLVRRRRLADDKKLDLKMKMQRVKKVVSLDAVGSYSIFRSDDRKTSLKAFGSTELWYDGQGFGLKKPGLGVQFTIYY